MGGDHGPDVTLPAALDRLRLDSALQLIVVGDETTLEAKLEQLSPSTDERRRIRIHHASQVVEMHDVPSKALRNKKDSSMRVAIDLIKAGEADACVSAGNTGALMATARFVLKMIPGIDRPAIISALPSARGHIHILDLGANVDSSAEHLYQFAVMGNELVKAVDGMENPSVGLLNIGEEAMKGNEQVKQAAKLLSDSQLNFIGFVEGNDIFTGNVDLIVTDGFVGNVALKASEGLSKMITNAIKQAFNKSWLTQLAGLVAMPVLKSFKQQIDPRSYGGATFLGLRGTVIKSHGGADQLAFSNAIRIACLEVKKAVPQHIEEHVSSVFAESKTA